MFALRITVLPNPYPQLRQHRDAFAFITAARLMLGESAIGDLQTCAELAVIAMGEVLS